MTCKYLTHDSTNLCLKGTHDCKWQGLADCGDNKVKYTHASYPGRLFYHCQRKIREWERDLRQTREKFWNRPRSFFLLPKDCREVKRLEKSLCKVCNKYHTTTVVCERCWDKIQLLKIQKGAMGTQEDF